MRRRIPPESGESSKIQQAACRSPLHSGNAVNFGSGYFPHLRKRPGMSGFYTIASSLNDYYRDHRPLSAERLAGITVDDCLAIFDQDPADAPARERMGMFAEAWNDLGRYLRDQFQGRFAARERLGDPPLAAGQACEPVGDINARGGGDRRQRRLAVP
jgi:hypothetical protein